MKHREYIDRLYQSSEELFIKYGYDDVTMEQICDAADVSKPTAYSAKLTKPALLAHLYKPDTDFSAHPLPDPDYLVCIDRHLDQVIDRIFHYGPDLLRDWFRMEIENAKPDYVIEKSWYKHLEELVKNAKASGQIDNPDSASVLTKLITNFLLGYTFEYSINEADKNRENLYRGVRTILRASEYYAI